MKVILEFNLPEEQTDLQDALDGSMFKHVLWKLDQYCRAEVKYASDMANDEVLSTYDEIRDKIRFFCDEMNVKFEE